MRFDLTNYETVQDRLDIFHKMYPNGRIETHLVENDGTRYVMKASAYRDIADLVPFTTGYAEEVVNSSPVNKTSAIENCETSAIGRCLRNGGIGKNASREEMEKVERRTAELDEAPASEGVTAESVVETAEGITSINNLRNLYNTTPADIKNTAWSWKDGSKKVEGTVGEYLVYLGNKLKGTDKK